MFSWTLYINDFKRKQAKEVFKPAPVLVRNLESLTDLCHELFFTQFSCGTETKAITVVNHSIKCESHLDFLCLFN